MSAAMRIGRNLAALRREKRLTQAELARRAGISVGYLREVEHGRTNLTLQIVLQLAAGLQVPFNAAVSPPKEASNALIISNSLSGGNYQNKNKGRNQENRNHCRRPPGFPGGRFRVRPVAAGRQIGYNEENNRRRKGACAWTSMRRTGGSSATAGSARGRRR